MFYIFDFDGVVMDTESLHFKAWNKGFEIMGDTLTEEEYEDSLIKKARINFRPGPVLAAALETLKFSKVPIKYAKEETSQEENTEEPEE